MLFSENYIKSFKVVSQQKQKGNYLYKQLVALKPSMASVAQKVYDEWIPEDEFDTGGICDIIASEISNVIASNISDISIEEYGWEGDDHAALIVSFDDERYVVDIPAYVYEIGGGYSWKKIPNVIISANDVVIERI